MSAGEFVKRRYELDNGDVVQIRVQPSTVTTWNPQATSSTLLHPDLTATVSQGKRTAGINARTARFEWASGVPSGYDPNGIITLPILTASAFDDLTSQETYSYRGGTIRPIGKTKETVR